MAVEGMREPFEIHLPHVQTTAQDGFHSFVVNTQDVHNLFLGQLSLTFDQRKDSVNVCTVTGLSDLGRSARSVPTSSKAAVHFSMVRRVITSVP
jgi:hypothetical protein